MDAQHCAIDAYIMPDAQQWAMLMPYWASIECPSYWASIESLSPEQFTFELGAHNTIVNNAHARAAQYGADGEQQKLKSLSREKRRLGANRLPCIGLNPTRSAYSGLDVCKTVRNKFPPCKNVRNKINQSLRNYSWIYISRSKESAV